jgi:hypothetical protein
MKWINKWFRAQPQAMSCPSSPRKQPSSPSLEGLEDRTVPTVTFHGGALLPHVQVQGLYIGNQWSSNATLAGQVSYLEGYLKSIVNSSYMDALTNAGYGVGRGSAVAGKISQASLTSGSTLNDSTIRSWLSTYASNGTLIAPNANSLYVCFVEPNVLVKAGSQDSHSNFLGYHWAFTAPNGATIHYAVMAYPGGATANASLSWLTSAQQLTEVTSHEIAEAATDPNGGGFGTLGWNDDSFPTEGEVGDITNAQACFVNGYAVQRIANKNDLAMTPAQATASRNVNFLLQTNGNLVEIVGGVTTALAGGMVYVSEQGIDNQGRATVDVVNSAGQAWEYHDGQGWVSLGGGVKYAVAGQGVSYVMFTNGNVSEFKGGAFTFLDSGAAKISAGTDSQGVNCVDIVYTSGNAWERSDSSGWHFIASGVQQLSAGRQGVSDYVTLAGAAHWHTEGGADVTVFSGGASQVAAGTDSNGNYMIDVLFSNGSVQEFRSGGSWVTLMSSGVKSLGKGRVDAVDMVLSSGAVWERTSAGWQFLSNGAAVAV